MTENLSLRRRIAARVARFDDRREDWTVFGFETRKNPKFARAQRRYIGASGSTDPSLNYIMGFDNLSLVPEPGHIALLGLGTLLLVWRLRRNKSR